MIAPANRRFDKLLIANRGEIAVRIIRAAQELGLATVAVYSEADEDSLAVRMADESVLIGPPHASKSYLRGDAILEAAARTGAGAIHPGYGFLSENANFADRVAQAGLVFVGPTAHAIRTMGDKAAARATAIAAGVPTVPGSPGAVTSAQEAVEIAERIGFPVMLKASAGGGGRGIRIAQDAAELARQFAVASSEAHTLFGNSELYLERFIRQARHIEVQVLGDGKNVIHCFERECSLQRRRQKIWEEAPSAAISAATRSALCESALKLARAVSYSGAGTLEYLYDDETGEFFFIEMNTRIQVEHPVTEMVTGLDLVREMLRVAWGEPLRFSQRDIRLHGTAIEVRINAEIVARNFLPDPGRVTQLVVPGGPGVRFDTMLYPGYTVPPYYDSMLGKLVVWAEDRPCAISRMRRALGELEIHGISTTADLHKALCDDPQIQQGLFHTGFLEDWLAAHPLSPPQAPANPASNPQPLIAKAIP